MMVHCDYINQALNLISDIFGLSLCLPKRVDEWLLEVLMAGALRRKPELFEVMLPEPFVGLLVRKEPHTF